MKRKTKKKPAPRAPKKRVTFNAEHVDWVIGVTDGGVRVKSFAVAHARFKKKFVCGRPNVAKWAGYKKTSIRSFAPPAAYEKKCRRCLNELYPTLPKRKR